MQDDGLDADKFVYQDTKKINDMEASRFPGHCLLWIIILMLPDVVDMSLRDSCCERMDLFANTTTTGILWRFI